MHRPLRPPPRGEMRAATPVPPVATSHFSVFLTCRSRSTPKRRPQGLAPRHPERSPRRGRSRRTSLEGRPPQRRRAFPGRGAGVPAEERFPCRRRPRPEGSFGFGRFAPSARDDEGWLSSWAERARRANGVEGSRRLVILSEALEEGGVEGPHWRGGLRNAGGRFPVGARASQQRNASLAEGARDRRGPSTPGASRPPLRMTKAPGSACGPPPRKTPPPARRMNPP